MNESKWAPKPETPDEKARDPGQFTSILADSTSRSPLLQPTHPYQLQRPVLLPQLLLPTPRVQILSSRLVHNKMNYLTMSRLLMIRCEFDQKKTYSATTLHRWHNLLSSRADHNLLEVEEMDQEVEGVGEEEVLKDYLGVVVPLFTIPLP